MSGTDLCPECGTPLEYSKRKRFCLVDNWNEFIGPTPEKGRELAREMAAHPDTRYSVKFIDHADGKTVWFHMNAGDITPDTNDNYKDETLHVRTMRSMPANKRRYFTIRTRNITHAEVDE